MTKKMVVFSLACLLLLLPLSAGYAKPFYEGKTIRIIVPYTPGGTYDTLARITSRHMPKYIPGTPTMIVHNIPGGGALIGIGAAYHAKPNGLTMVHCPSSTVLTQLLGLTGDIDLLKFNWLASAAGEYYTAFIVSSLPYRTIEDLQKAPKPVKFAGFGRTTISSLMMAMLKGLVGLNIEIIRGYRGMSDAALAVQGGEAEGTTAPTVSYFQQATIKDMYKSGFIRVVLQVRARTPTEKDIEVTKGLPEASDYVTDPKKKELWDLGMKLLSMGRFFAATPGTPAECVEILGDAMWKTLNDPKFVAEASATGFEISPSDAKAVTGLMKSYLAMSEEVKAGFLDMLK